MVRKIFLFSSLALLSVVVKITASSCFVLSARLLGFLFQPRLLVESQADIIRPGNIPSRVIYRWIKNKMSWDVRSENQEGKAKKSLRLACWRWWSVFFFIVRSGDHKIMFLNVHFCFSSSLTVSLALIVATFCFKVYGFCEYHAASMFFLYFLPLPTCALSKNVRRNEFNLSRNNEAMLWIPFFVTRFTDGFLFFSRCCLQFITEVAYLIVLRCLSNFDFVFLLWFYERAWWTQPAKHIFMAGEAEKVIN